MSDVITQQTRFVSESLQSGDNNGWKEAVEQLVSPSKSRDTTSTDHVHSLVQQFQPIPNIQRPVLTDPSALSASYTPSVGSACRQIINVI